MRKLANRLVRHQSYPRLHILPVRTKLVSRPEACYLRFQGSVKVCTHSRSSTDDLRVLEAEEYTILKVKLETEIQTLEQHLQEMKSTYLLNNEKLSHDFRLLGERDFEHTQLI